MKTTMKKTITVVAAVALTFAFGMAYAADDQMPDMNANKDTGTALYEAYLENDAHLGIGAAAGGVRVEAAARPHDTNDSVQFMSTKDSGTELYEAFLKDEANIAKGSATGGVRDWSGDHAKTELPSFLSVITE